MLKVPADMIVKKNGFRTSCLYRPEAMRRRLRVWGPGLGVWGLGFRRERHGGRQRRQSHQGAAQRLTVESAAAASGLLVAAPDASDCRPATERSKRSQRFKSLQLSNRSKVSKPSKRSNQRTSRRAASSLEGVRSFKWHSR